MKQIKNWNDVKEMGGEIENLPVGGYVCEIKKCTEVDNKNNSGTHLEILFDIVEGDCRGWFEQDYRSQSREDKFWRGVVRQNIPDETSSKYDIQCGFFKRFTNSLEASNEGYHWDWDETKLKGKKIGVIFGAYERESQKGTRYMSTRADSVTNVDAVRTGKYKVPEPKMLSGGTAPTPAAADSWDDGELPF